LRRVIERQPADGSESQCAFAPAQQRQWQRGPQLRLPWRARAAGRDTDHIVG